MKKQTIYLIGGAALIAVYFLTKKKSTGTSTYTYGLPVQEQTFQQGTTNHFNWTGA